MSIIEQRLLQIKQYANGSSSLRQPLSQNNSQDFLVLQIANPPNFAFVEFLSISLTNKKDPSKDESFLLAEDETRTRDILLGRQKLYQLSYFRKDLFNCGGYFSVGRANYELRYASGSTIATELLPQRFLDFCQTYTPDTYLL